METIKLIAMDMDGTLLLDGGKGIPADNITALREAHQAGIHLALCSGRVPDDMGFYALDAGVPMHILALNGTCVMDGPLGSILRSDHIADDAARRITAIIREEPVHYGIFSDFCDLFGSVSLCLTACGGAGLGANQYTDSFIPGLLTGKPGCIKIARHIGNLH